MANAINVPHSCVSCGARPALLSCDFILPLSCSSTLQASLLLACCPALSCNLWLTKKSAEFNLRLWFRRALTLSAVHFWTYTAHCAPSCAGANMLSSGTLSSSCKSCCHRCFNILLYKKTSSYCVAALWKTQSWRCLQALDPHAAISTAIKEECPAMRYEPSGYRLRIAHNRLQQIFCYIEQLHKPWDRISVSCSIPQIRDLCLRLPQEKERWKVVYRGIDIFKSIVL